MKIYLLNTLKTGIVFAELLSREIEIAGIIAIKKECSDKINEYYDYGNFCKLHKTKLIEVNSYALSDEDDKRKIEELEIDIVITSAWQRLVPKWLIEHCKIGGIGVHGSSSGISQGRGRSPQNWALLSGKDRFYISLFWLNKGIDDGDVIDTKEFCYELIDDIAISYEKESIAIAQMLVDNIRNGNIEKHYGKKQVEDGKYLPKRVEADGMIDWNRSCIEIYNFVRALTIPYPCAYTEVNDIKIKIIECKYIVNESNLLSKYRCGEVVMDTENFVWIKCKDGVIEIRKNINKDISGVKVGDVMKQCSFNRQIENIIERHKAEVGLPVAKLVTELLVGESCVEV